MTPSTKRLQLKSSPFLLDLLQVDLLASGASLFWPRSDLPRATKSYEIRRRTFLKVFLFVYSSIFKLHPYRPRFYAAQSGVWFNEALVKVVTHRLAVVISLQLETMGSIFPTIWRDAVLVAFVCLFVSLQLETTGSIFLPRIWRDVVLIAFVCRSNRCVFRMHSGRLLITVFGNWGPLLSANVFEFNASFWLS